MINDAGNISDPLGNQVFLSQSICIDEARGEEDAEIYDDAARVIEKPAMLYEMKENGESIFYYFRLIGFSNTMLIRVQSINARLEATRCTRNPSREELNFIMQTGRQLI